MTSRILIALLAGATALSACSLPRGAALQSEVLREADAEIPSFQVMPVTRATMPLIANWPRTGEGHDTAWPRTATGSSESVIQTGDKVDITIWDSQENSLITTPTQKSTAMPGVEVAGDGTVFVPYVNEVQIRGLTPAAARARIQAKLESIVPSAQVQLSLTQGRGNSVELVGGVSSPGAFPMPSRNYKILGLIADGGGISSSLRNPRVRLMRGGTTYEISAGTLLESSDYNALLYPGDTIIVEEDDKSFTALGASGTESLIYFPKDRLTALEAISLMGGLSDQRADPKGVLVLREYDVRHLRSGSGAPNMQQVVFTFDLTSADGLFAARKFAINPGDTVLATESPVTRAQTIFGLIGNAFGVSRQVATISN